MSGIFNSSSDQVRLEQLLSKSLIYRDIKDALSWTGKADLVDSIKSRLKLWLDTYFGRVIKDDGSVDRIWEWEDSPIPALLAQWDSKSRRLEKIEANIEEVVMHLLFCILALGETTAQATASMLGSILEPDNKLDAAKSGLEILFVCDGLGYDIERPKLYSGETYKVLPNIKLPEEIMARINISLFMPPMLELPRRWENNFDGGYKLNRHCAILGHHLNKHENKLNLNVLNILQNVRYKLDEVMCSLDDTFEPEFKKATKEQREQAYENYKLMLMQNRSVYNFFKDKEFYFVWQYDKRGRAYDKGYHIHCQGNEYRKAMLKFANAQKVNERGLRWLKIDLANSYGLDKELFDDRVKFINDNIDDIFKDPNKWINAAEEPLLFTSALRSYKQYLETGMSDQIVRLDATTSGVQLMSVAMRDKEAMKLLNVIGDDTRYDFYTEVAKETFRLTPNWYGWDKDADGKVDFAKIRNKTKKATMTYFYNSESKPKEIFGLGEELQTYFSVLNNLAKGATELQSSINELWDNEATEYCWTMPDGHFVKCPVLNTKKAKIEIPEAKGGKAYIKYEYNDVCAGEEKKRSLAPNVIHSIDAWVMRQLVTMCNERGIEISPIHDSFGCHPNDCDEVRKIYRHILARIYRENIVDNILSQLSGKEVVTNRADFDEDVYQAIKDNDNGYYIC